jgi:hypothetical protein
MQKSTGIDLIGDRIASLARRLGTADREASPAAKQVGAVDREGLVEISADDLHQVAGGFGVDGTHN